MPSPPYSSGTATVENGSIAVVGSGTSWVTSLVTGGLFIKNGFVGVIASVTDNTHLELVNPWAGPSGTGAYAIQRENTEASDIVDLFDKLTTVLRTLGLTSIKPDDLGTLTYRDTLDLGPTDKFVFLHAELGEPLQYYVWNGPEAEEWLGPYDTVEPAEPGPSGVGDKFDLSIWIQGKPRAGETVLRHVFSGSASIEFPAGLDDSQASSEAASTGEAEFTIRYNGDDVGTITFNVSDVGAFSLPSLIGTVEGDVLEIIAPATQDATLSGVSITLAGDRV